MSGHRSSSGSRPPLTRSGLLLAWLLVLVPLHSTPIAAVAQAIAPPAPVTAYQPLSRPRRPLRVTAPVPLSTGWNLLALPVQQAAFSSASGLVSAVNGQLGPGTIAALAVYGQGRYRPYVPGFSADLPISPAQGIFLLSTSTGTWTPTGTPFSAPQTVYLQDGWNLVAAPFPSPSLDTATMASEIGACVHEIVTYSRGSYSTWLPGMSTQTVPSTAGMWVLCSGGIPWSPMPPVPANP